MRKIKLFVCLLLLGLALPAWSDVQQETEAILAADGDEIVESLAELTIGSQVATAAVVETVTRQRPRIACEVVQAAAVRAEDAQAELAFENGVNDANDNLADKPALQEWLRQCLRQVRQVAFGGHRVCTGADPDCDSRDRVGEDPESVPRDPPASPM